MALDACKGEIAAALGRELSKREEGIVSRRASELKRKIDMAANDPAAFGKVIQDYADEAAAQANQARRTAAINYRAFATQKAWHETVEPLIKNPGEALSASVRGSLFNFPGSKDSAAIRAQHESNARSSAFQADLVKNKVDAYAFDRANNDAIGQALWEMRNGSDEAGAATKVGPMAAKAAAIFENHREMLRQALNAAGAWIGKNSDAIFRRTHDANKISKAGGFKYGSDEARSYWADTTAKKMDWQKSFDGEFANDTAKRQEVLDSLHTQFAAGTHLKGSNGGYGLGPRNVGRKVSHQRQIVFKSAQDEIAYLNEFGRGNSIGEIVDHELRSGGKDIGVMSKFGVNPEAVFDRIYEDRAKALRAANDTKGLKQLTDTYQKLKDNDWNLLTGITGHPADNFVARFASAGKVWTSAAAISNSIWSLTGDTVLKASAVTQRSGGSVAAGIFNGYIRNFVGTGMTKDAQMAFAAENGIRFEGISTPIDPYSSDSILPGLASKFMRAVTKWGWHNGWVNRERINSLTADSNHYWALRDTKFEDMRPSEQGALQQFGIDAKGWDILRQQAATDITDGQKGFTPLGILKMDLEKFQTGDLTEAQLTRARQTLSDQYRNLLGEMADRSTVSPSIANQAFMGLGRKGLQQDTVAGFMYHNALALKGFVVNYMRSHMGRELYGYSSEYRSFPQAMADMFTGKNPRAAIGMSKLMVAGALNFYVVNALKDLAVGKTPLDPFDWDVKKHGSLWDTPGFNAAMKAWSKQSFGLYGDVLMGDSGGPPKSWLEKVPEDFIGPEGEFVGNMADNVTNFVTAMGQAGGPKAKDLDKASQQLFGTLWRQAPGTSLFWTKFAADHFLYNNLAEAMNPGYKKRLQKRTEKQGQTYLLGGP